MSLLLRLSTGCGAVALCAALSGCGDRIPKEALRLSAESLSDRLMQTRRFENTDEKTLLLAAVSLAQDLGYTIDDSDTTLGVVVASKNRDATDSGQVTGAIFLAAFTGVRRSVDKVQKIRISMVTRPVTGGISFRATFQRVVWNSDGEISRLEGINDPEIYQQFFEKLSRAVFLEAHEI